MIEVTPHIGLLHVDLFIGEAQSLKQKRMVLRRLKDKVRNKFNVSVAELGGQDKWQVATLAFAMIGKDQRYINKILENILSLIERYRAAEITDHQIEFL